MSLLPYFFEIDNFYESSECFAIFAVYSEAMFYHQYQRYCTHVLDLHGLKIPAGFFLIDIFGAVLFTQYAGNGNVKFVFVGNKNDQKQSRKVFIESGEQVCFAFVLFSYGFWYLLETKHKIHSILCHNYFNLQ